MSRSSYDLKYIENQETKDRLKPCPFCGPFTKENQAHFTICTDKKDHKTYIRCDGCGCEAWNGTDSLDDAIKSWNTRNGTKEGSTDLTDYEKRYLDNLFWSYQERLSSELQKKMHDELYVLSKYKGELVRGFKELNGHHGTMVGVGKEILDKQDEIFAMQRTLIRCLVAAFPSVKSIIEGEEG